MEYMTPYREYVLGKLLESRKSSVAKEQPTIKEAKPLIEINKVAADFGLDWTDKDPVDKTGPKENPIDIMFTKARKGQY